MDIYKMKQYIPFYFKETSKNNAYIYIYCVSTVPTAGNSLK